MTGADRVSVPAQGQLLDLGGKKVEDLIGPETTIQWSGTDGTVTGSIKKLDTFPEWGAPDGGHFFPAELDEQYEGMEITGENCGGAAVGPASGRGQEAGKEVHL